MTRVGKQPHSHVAMLPTAWLLLLLLLLLPASAAAHCSSSLGGGRWRKGAEMPSGVPHWGCAKPPLAAALPLPPPLPLLLGVRASRMAAAPRAMCSAFFPHSSAATIQQAESRGVQVKAEGLAATASKRACRRGREGRAMGEGRRRGA